MSDWLPTREQDFVDTCDKWVIALDDEEYQTKYHVDAGLCKGVVNDIKEFLAARELYNNMDTSYNLTDKNKKKEKARSSMRDFANSSVRYNNYIDDAAKLYLGLRPKETSPTARTRPTSQPITVAENTLNRFEHKIRAKSREGGRDTSKPADAYGVRYAWQVGGERPASGADLPKSQFNRRTCLVVSHTENDKGKQVWYACCYENGKGEGGPWSAMVEMYIG